MTEDELIQKTNSAISELVYDKTDLLKAYNYYNGIRDAELFRYLEENFGLGNPTSIEFTPLIRKHIDAIIGEYLGVPILPRISCKDSETIGNILRDKLLKIISEVHKVLTKNLKNNILSFINGKDVTDPLIEQLLQQVVEEIDNSFISEYEIAALNVIEYIMQSRDTDIIGVLRELLLDLLVSGYTFYKVEPTVEKNNIKIKPLSPLNVFPDRNIESAYVKNSHRIVVRYWMTKSQILNKYGRELTEEDKKSLEDHWEEAILNYSALYIRHFSGTTKGILADKEVIIPGCPSEKNYFEYIPVYEIEWIETDKDYVMLRYETVRIGGDIFILRGKVENVIRSKDNPSYCSLSVNGIYYLNRGIKPYSLVLACAHLLDKYDILGFYRDRLIASSGTTGDFVDVSLLPTFLGSNTPERLLKFIAYKKGGIAPIDSSLPGRLENGQTAMNTTFAGFDDTLKAQSIQAIQIAMEAVEKDCSDITGVFRERLNGIELRDAVTNIKIGLNNSFNVTRQYIHLMDTLVNEILLDSLNLAKIVFKNGLKGTYILGDKYQKTFTALSEYFTLTDYDINIITSSEIIKDIEYLRLMIPELVKANAVTPDIIFEAMTSKSLTDIKLKVRKAIKKLKEENNQLQLLNQQFELALLLVKELSQLLEQALKKIEQLNESKLEIETKKMLLEYQVKWFSAQTDRTYKEKMAEEAMKRTEAELLQLADGNPYNDKIRQI